MNIVRVLNNLSFLSSMFEIVLANADIVLSIGTIFILKIQMSSFECSNKFTWVLKLNILLVANFISCVVMLIVCLYLVVIVVRYKAYVVWIVKGLFHINRKGLLLFHRLLFIWTIRWVKKGLYLVVLTLSNSL